ncbi:MAG: RNA methyltransferase [Clostridia bacterium]|nr:RNA methyltransferase [Clostridia bacterium]
MMERITSLQNEYIKKLCRLHLAAERRKSGLFLIEGQKLCAEALKSGWEIERCLVTEKEQSSPLIHEIQSKTVIVSDHIAKKLSTMDTVPGIFMVVQQKTTAIPQTPDFILALDHLADPSNLGAILRSAEAFGTELVYLSEGCVDLYSPKVLRAAMGSVFRVPVLKGNLSDFLEDHKSKGYRVYGAGLDRDYLELPDVSFKEPSIMIIGNESNGISKEIMTHCDSGVFIPMLGKNESLNAAVAASIILWEQSKWR